VNDWGLFLSLLLSALLLWHVLRFGGDSLRLRRGNGNAEGINVPEEKTPGHGVPLRIREDFADLGIAVSVDSGAVFGVPQCLFHCDSQYPFPPGVEEDSTIVRHRVAIETTTPLIHGVHVVAPDRTCGTSRYFVGNLVLKTVPRKHHIHPLVVTVEHRFLELALVLAQGAKDIFLVLVGCLELLVKRDCLVGREVLLDVFSRHLLVVFRRVEVAQRLVPSLFIHEVREVIHELRGEIDGFGLGGGSGSSGGVSFGGSGFVGRPLPGPAVLREKREHAVYHANRNDKAPYRMFAGKLCELAFSCSFGFFAHCQLLCVRPLSLV